MNVLPILALGILASGYAVAIENTDRKFDTMPQPELTAYTATASADLSVYDVLSHGAQPVDEPHCGEHRIMAATLSEDFAERSIERRTIASDMQLELWASSLMGTWTMVHKGDDGISCIIASGTGWSSSEQTSEVFGQVALAY